MWDGRWLRSMATFALAVGGWAWLHSFWRSELYHLTGEAQWVWVTKELERPYPTQGVFEARFQLAQPGPGALLKVCADREYVAWVNGVVAGVGWSRPGFRLDVYDVSHLLRPGSNSVRIEVRSPTPVGGLLAALDLPGGKKNAVLSGRDFLLVESSGRRVPAPVVWGRPPRYPWAYPRPMPRPRTLDQIFLEEPVALSQAQQVAPRSWLFRLNQPIFGYVRIVPSGEGWLWYAVGREGEGLAELRERIGVYTASPNELWDPEPQWVSQVLVVARSAPAGVEVFPVLERFRARAPGAVQGKLGPVPRTRWRFRNPPE